ncbi:very short patch repair endonuclease [Acidaminococcus intestini]|uniref:very short patch repair endonuclease n=1 Tax=Acidaminococcus intestini TaxID=187327 RepID=UPI00242B0BD7|nr:very short patch repair endonuclease [Acidaminococcus intestini]
MTKEKLITTPERSKIMSRIRGKNTTPERMLRKALWSHGIRYRKNYRKLPGSPDIAITRYWIAIFVDGDFWHARGHQDNPGEQIKNNKEFWSKKLRRNVERDKDNDAALTDLGWLVLHFWESDIKKDLDGCVKTVLEYCGK